jgi:hypothetical protein
MRVLFTRAMVLFEMRMFFLGLPVEARAVGRRPRGNETGGCRRPRIDYSGQNARSSAVAILYAGNGSCMDLLSGYAM